MSKRKKGIDRYYQALLRLDPTVTDHAEYIGRKTKEIEEMGGKIHRSFEWTTGQGGTRRLAYPINKMTTARDYLIYFETQPSTIAPLVEELKMQQEVLTHGIFAIEKSQIPEDNKLEFKALKEST